MSYWIKSNIPQIVGILAIAILAPLKNIFPDDFKYFENWLSPSASLITILAFFFVFWQWKKQIVANKKDVLSSKLINLLIHINKDIKLLRTPLQEFPNYEKKSDQYAWRFKFFFTSIQTKQSDIEAVLVEFSIIGENKLEEIYNNGLNAEINKLYRSYEELIENQIDLENGMMSKEDFDNREKELKFMLWSTRKENDVMGQKIDNHIKKMISMVSSNIIR